MWKPNVLVISSGGIKGFIYLGALIILEREGLLKDIRDYCGISVGSMISLLLIAGYSPEEIIREAADTDILDIGHFDIRNSIKNIGLISNEHIRDKLVVLMSNKFGFVPTLSQLYNATGLTYTSVTMNLDKNITEYISWKTYPELSCVDAVLLSINIPFVFYKIECQGNTYIDGAFGNPYPLNIYDNGDNDILGMVIFPPDVNIKHDLILYADRIIHSAIDQMKRMVIDTSSNMCRHMMFIDNFLNPANIRIDGKKKSAMIIYGFREGEKFVETLTNSQGRVKEKTL